MCGCGRTSMPEPGASSAGPIWSKKTKGPMLRRSGEGSTRRTSNPPMSRGRGTMTVSRVPQAGGVFASGSSADSQLISLSCADYGKIKRLRWNCTQEAPQNPSVESEKILTFKYEAAEFLLPNSSPAFKWVFVEQLRHICK